jgi:histidyl-tRNA synthetase
LRRRPARLCRYNFGEIRTPIFEDTQLFARGVGEETDIVSKEMYTWEDRARAQSEKAQSLTLRPENTAGVVRAYIEHGLGESGMLQKLYYIGPQFRRERPQKGRYRQFWQIGAEVIGPPSSGSESPLRDAEVLEMLAAFLMSWAFTGWTLLMNSVGSASDRPRYIAALREALRPVRRRCAGLPAAGGDESAARAGLQGAGRPADYCGRCRRSRTIWTTNRSAHFAAARALDACGVAYDAESRLVAGWTTTRGRLLNFSMAGWARRMLCWAADGMTAFPR